MFGFRTFFTGTKWKFWIHHGRQNSQTTFCISSELLGDASLGVMEDEGQKVNISRGIDTVDSSEGSSVDEGSYCTIVIGGSFDEVSHGI
eukprot:8669894-Ditylum_brightwellii.AAC.1